jgi:hypothetical protein
MGLQEVQGWAAVAVAVSTVIGILVTVYEYRLKIRAETRLTQSTTAETDVRLLQLFTETLFIASGRKGDAVYSKEVLALMIEKGMLTTEDFKTPDVLKEKIAQAALLAQVPGEASAIGALAAISILARRHEVLREPAIEALQSLQAWKPTLVERYLNSIRQE